MELTYYTAGGSGDAGDQYTGLDRFGRVVDQRWDLNGVDLERLKYGYDPVNNQVWRQNTVAATGQDHYYTDDGLYQLKTLQRGTLNATQTGINGTPSWEEDWNYDPVGNWNGTTSAYQTKVAGTTTLNQNRTHSTVNEITGLTTSTGTVWITVVHDAAGNMTSAPQPLSPGNGYTLTYDAWNRLMQLKNGNMVMAAYAYDGASRRTTKTVGNTLRHYYYDDRWRIVEERLNTTTTADRRFVWGIRRLDDLILRDQAVAVRLYALDDKINVTAVVDTSGTVQERYSYNGFGGVNYMDAGFNPIPASAFDWETLFDSYRYDTDTGFYQVRYRYLHPLLGRWISRDPLGELDEKNLYGFVRNQPISCWDSLGLLSASGGVPTVEGVVSWHHGAYLTFTIYCPENTIFRFDHVDYSGAIPALESTFGATAVMATPGINPIPPASGLGGFEDKIKPNPNGANCCGDPCTVMVFMRTRFTSQNPIWGAGSDSAAGVAAYVAGTVIFYDCVPCRGHGSHLIP